MFIGVVSGGGGKRRDVEKIESRTGWVSKSRCPTKVS